MTMCHPSLTNFDLRYGAVHPLEGVRSSWRKILGSPWTRVGLESGFELLLSHDLILGKYISTSFGNKR